MDVGIPYFQTNPSDGFGTLTTLENRPNPWLFMLSQALLAWGKTVFFFLRIVEWGWGWLKAFICLRSPVWLFLTRSYATLNLLLELPARSWCHAFFLIFELPTCLWYCALHLPGIQHAPGTMLSTCFWKIQWIQTCFARIFEKHEDAMVRYSKLECGCHCWMELDLPTAMALQQSAQALANGA